MNEMRELRFGVIAIELGFVTRDQLVEALLAQIDDNIGKRRHRLIGTILFDLGHITHKQIDKVLEKAKQIIQ